MKKTVSIIICTRDRADHLRRTLGTAAELQIPADVQLELIVVDNASTDATSSVIECFRPANMRVRLISEPRAGLSRARNAGMSAANGEIILFTDDDVRLPSDWIEMMCRPLIDGSADAVAGRVRLAPHLERQWMNANHRATLAATDLVKFENPGVMMGANMGFSTRVLDKVPAFDPEIGAGALGTAEDTLFAWQLVEAGYTIAGVADSCVVHHCDEGRLSRNSFMGAAGKLGRSYSYIYHHWQHEIPRWARGSTILIWQRLLRCSVKWLYWRCRRWKECNRKEGISKWEFDLIMEIHNVRQHLIERDRPRNYTRRGYIYRSHDGRSADQTVRSIPARAVVSQGARIYDV